MERMAGSLSVEGLLIDWVQAAWQPEPQVPADWLDDGQVAAELGRIERNRARETAREAELILRLAQLRPDHGDRLPGTPGARRRGWRKTDPELPGVSEFFCDELAHLLNLGRGTAAFRARRAHTWQQNTPGTLAAMGDGRIDERRAGVLADVLQHTTPQLGRAVEAGLLPEAAGLSLAELRRRALAALAELDAAAIEQRHQEAAQAADVRTYPTGDGMAVLAGDLTVEQAAACHAVIDELARMAKADGDDRPIGAIRASILAMLILRPADSGLPGGVRVQLTVSATLDTLEGRSTAAGEINGSAVTAGQLRDLLHRVNALGLTTPQGGTLTFALTDADGRLLATLSATELTHLATTGCPAHPTDPCDCPVLGPPPPTDTYQPSTAQHRFIDTRDRRCRMPTCGQRTGWADHDHVIPHATGGHTTCTNLCCLCRSHHRLKTLATGWAFHMDPDGTLHVTSPSGITRTTRPPGLHPPQLRPPSQEPPPYHPADDPPPF